MLIADSGSGVGLQNLIHEFQPDGTWVRDFDGAGGPEFHPGPMSVNSQGELLIADGITNTLRVYGPAEPAVKISNEAPTAQTTTSGAVHATVDPNGSGPVLTCEVQYGTDTSYASGTVPCSPSLPPDYTAATQVSATLPGLTAEATYHYRFVVTNATGAKLGADQAYTPHEVVALSASPASEVTSSSAKLNATWTGNGQPTTYHFEWGRTTDYGHTTAAPPAVPGGVGDPVAGSFDLAGLEAVADYHYRVVATNASGTSVSADRRFETPPAKPDVNAWIDTVHSDSVVMHAAINAGGDTTVYRFEFGKTSAYGGVVPGPEGNGGTRTVSREVPQEVLTGLDAGTEYHYRVVAENRSGTTTTDDRTFTTFPQVGDIKDPCPNSLVRKQTGAALLPDCRAYELVSAAETGGYDVESSLVPGQHPLAGYPAAESPSQVLYTIHFGAIPGIGDPPNFGDDPYVATRTDTGWMTGYVGIPVSAAPDETAFSSALIGADNGLDTFAFGGSATCSPCFPGGTTGIPLRTREGALVQGMSGSLSPAAPVADGYIAKYFSADGSHFLFGSVDAFESDGNSNGDVSIYDRDMDTGLTQVVSRTPAGANLPCLAGAGTCHSPGSGDDIAALDISSDGDRIVVAQKVDLDAAGNRLWHLYMHVGSSPNTIDLTPGATEGVLYDGMSSDGSSVYFSSPQSLTADDHDSSTDLFRASVAGTAATLTRVSGAGGSGDTDSCTPEIGQGGHPWNTAGAAQTCGIVAVAGGAGVAASNGTVYFLTPELLVAGGGVPGAPNLYVSGPGKTPKFVVTLEPTNDLSPTAFPRPACAAPRTSR